MLRAGRKASKKTIGEIRDLTREDLPRIMAPRPKSASIAKLRDSHHRICRLYASGLNHSQVSAHSGFSISRCTALYADPTVQNQILEYRKMEDQSWRQEIDEWYGQAIKNKMTAERMISDRLERAEEEGEEVPLKTLVSIVADRADRTGHGKKQTVTSVHLDLGLRLERARQRSQSLPDPKIIDVQAAPVRQAPQLVSSSRTMVPAAEPFSRRRLP